MSKIPPVADPITAADAKPASRWWYLVDRLRLPAIFDIVGFHVGDGRHPLGGIGLPVFLLISCALGTRKNKVEPFVSTVRRVASKLVPVWLFWSAAYGLFVVLRTWHHHGPIWAGLEPRMLLYGTSIHLWYLPFIGGAVVVVNRLQKIIEDQGVWAQIGLGAVLGCACIVAVTLSAQRRSLPVPFEQWRFAISSLPLGLAIGGVMRLPERERLRCVRAIVVIAGGVCASLWPWVQWSIPIRYAAAIAILSLALVTPGRFSPLWEALSLLSFGIYLVHEFIADLLVSHFGLSALPLMVQTVIVVAASAAVVAVMNRTPLRRFVRVM